MGRFSNKGGPAVLLASAAAFALAGCSATTGADRPATSAAPAAGEEAYASTYQAFPGVPTAIVGATVYDGAGGMIENGTVLFADGEVVGIGGADLAIPAGYTRVDGTGKFVTPGVIDIHSHLGDYPTPSVDAHSDGNEATDPTTPEVWAEHSVWPQDPGFSRALANGGVTSLQILPGSANLMGGRSVTLKNVPSRTVQGMKFPGAPYSLKMACGENPKRVYGGRGRMPSTRMGNFAVNRETFIEAQQYMAEEEPDRDLAMETLAGVLSGDITVQNHCYRADEMALVLDMAEEFGYTVAAFHHAVESYKIGDLLRENEVCSAVWADWYGFKMEAYDAIPENAAMIHNQGACVVIHSDDENGIQRLNQEAAKAQADGRRMGIDIPDADVISWITLNAARAMGIGDVTGSLEAGKMADVVLWNGDPLSVYSRPEMVWIDGAMMYDMNDPAMRPVSDFELGQPGEGDVK
ncbi:amidohydrolase [Aurantiacibacter poecillastricola]|uniref:amidohydrolase n=1 Tax=Aurantiacibacter poecillastricola TaxID=3064385 RepID=UPI00273CFB12|nr:amidohydrolase [Aurantiacibacter sp. 219JJ12-13]MDP5260640.1 amidohydrolase [Aurantiacibacter sp. 219JJ12-13]